MAERTSSTQRRGRAQGEAPAGTPAPRLGAVAYYRDSADDLQENSIAIQQGQVGRWARENGLEIIQEFADLGPCEPTAEGRPNG